MKEEKIRQAEEAKKDEKVLKAAATGEFADDDLENVTGGVANQSFTKKQDTK